VQGTTGHETSKRATGRGRVNDHIRRWHLLQQLSNRTDEAERAERIRGAEWNEVWRSSCLSQAVHRGHRRCRSLVTRRDILDVGAEERVEQRVCGGPFGRAAVDDERAVQSRLRGESGCGTRVVGLHAAERHEGVRTACYCVRSDDRELAYFVAAKPKGIASSRFTKRRGPPPAPLAGATSLQSEWEQ